MKKPAIFKRRFSYFVKPGKKRQTTLKVHSELQEAMDVFTDREFLNGIIQSGACAAVISEEQEELMVLGGLGESHKRYWIALDPLDGSSNVAVNIPAGTIFSVFEVPEPGELPRGDRQVAAGYFLYGSATVFVLADAAGVNGFTLDKPENDFVLSHAGVRVTETGHTYAVNDGNYHLFSRGTQNYIRYCRQQADLEEKPYAARYSGSMVADLHRVLLRGGIFHIPERPFIRRESFAWPMNANPMAFIFEQAGGMAISGMQRTLSVPLHLIHQRSPIMIGSPQIIRTAARFSEPNYTLFYEHTW